MTRISLVSSFSKALTPVLLLAIAGAAQASTYYVGSPGIDISSGGEAPGYPFATIQYAINTASTGDTIFVLADTYSGAGNTNLDFGGKNLTLEALPYYGTATTVTIDCQGIGRGFHFHNGESPKAVVDSFNVINGNPGTYEFGGGAYISDISSPTFIDCTFASNKAYTGGAVYMVSSSPTFTGTTFSKNSATEEGGAVCQDSGCYPIYSHSKFTTNKAVHGGALLTYSSDGAFYNDTFTGNTASDGGAIFNAYQCYPAFYGGTFSGNKATFQGGAFYNSSSSPTFYNTLIVGNSAEYGGAVSNYHFSSPGFVNATITGNKAAFNGGAIYSYDHCDPYFNWSILWGNKVGASDNEIDDSDDTSSSEVYFSDIKGGWSGYGVSNLNIDPKFVSTTDFHLKSTSPLIDAGSSTGETLTDHDGNPRVCNDYTDLGAYELALPTANADSYGMFHDTTLTIKAAIGVLANDLANKGGTLSAILVTKPVYGTLSLKSDGSFTYKAPTGFTGVQTFTYKAKNSKGSSSLATVTIQIFTVI